MERQEDEVKNIGLSETEVLQEVFKTLQQKLNGKEIALENPGLSEVADDSDYHRQRAGYMSYDTICILTIGKTTWAIAVGYKRGSYPGENQYASDLVALKMGNNISNLKEETICETFIERIESEVYFKNSILIGLRSGDFGTLNDFRLGKKVLGALTSDLICQEPIINSEFVNLDLSSIYEQTTRYYEVAVDQLSDAIVEALSSESLT